MRSHSKIELYPTFGGKVGIKQYGPVPLSRIEAQILALALLRHTADKSFSQELCSQEIRKVFDFPDHLIEELIGVSVLRNDDIVQDNIESLGNETPTLDNRTDMEAQIIRRLQKFGYTNFDEVIMFMRLFCRQFG